MAKESFEEFYRRIYGTRWDALREALTGEEAPKRSIDGLIEPYFMDDASIETALLLPVEEGNEILDMCAAPGGKTIVLLSRLNGTGRLVSNDRSPDRRERMRRAIASSCPEKWRSASTITGHDASRWGLYEKEAYDAILLDAPCSSERHVLTSPEHYRMWSPSRPKRLKAQQFAMLSSAFLALRHGGFLLYSTCSINPEENEEIIARLMKRHPGEVEEAKIMLTDGEKREHGMIVLPDTAKGRGPMYAALLRKI